MLSTAFTLLPLALSVVGAAAGSRPRMVHKGVARRAHGDVQLAKRSFTNARWSFYDVGLGACGGTNVASDYIVALNSEQYGTGYPGPYCNKQITMTYNGKTATATIADECPGCPYGGLDLSRGLFDHFADEDTGIIYGEWSFVDGTDAAATAATTTKVATTTKAAATTTKAAVTTTSKKAAATTTAAPIVAAVTTSTKAPTSTHKASSSSKAATSSLASYSASFAAASSSVASLASSFSAIPSASASSTANATDTIEQIQNNLDALNTLLTSLGKLVMSSTLSDSTD